MTEQWGVGCVCLWLSELFFYMFNARPTSTVISRRGCQRPVHCSCRLWSLETVRDQCNAMLAMAVRGCQRPVHYSCRLWPLEAVRDQCNTMLAITARGCQRSMQYDVGYRLLEVLREQAIQYNVGYGCQTLSETNAVLCWL